LRIIGKQPSHFIIEFIERTPGPVIKRLYHFIKEGTG